MRKLFTLLLLALFLSGAALAQDDAAATVDLDPQADFYGTTQWAGIGLGYPVTFYYGINDLISDNIDLRIRANSYFYNLAIGADALFDVLRIEDAPINIYAGGGPTLGIGFGGRGFGLGLNASVGGEYRFTEQIGAFAELGVGYVFYTGTVLAPFGGFAPGGSIGVNFHF